MKNFIILFNGKEGTSPLVRLLDNFKMISILRQVDNQGWEPFDRHACGYMSLNNLINCLEMIYDNNPIDFHKLNRIYTRTASHPLQEIDQKPSIGFKMRFHPPTYLGSFSNINSLTYRAARFHLRTFRDRMFDLFRRNEVVVLNTVRQDVLRWGLSKYHGDGTGKHGHLQFKLASGELSRKDIGKIQVDLNRLEKIISDCEDLHQHKQDLIEDLNRAGIENLTLCYEDFLLNKKDYFRKILESLEINISEEEIRKSLEVGSYFKKVHSDDISEFVINHEEITDKFNDRFIPWE